MGALDWLTDLIGGSSGGMQMPPMQGLDDRPSMPYPQGGDPMAGMGTPPYPQGTDPMTAGLKPPFDPMRTQPMPPVQPTETPPVPPYPQGTDPMTAGGSPPAPPYPQGTDPMTAGGPPGLPPGIPLPQARPAGAPQVASPPTAPLPGGGAQPPLPPTDVSGAMRSYQQAGGTMAPPAAPGGDGTAKTIIGRALGLDGNRETQIRGALGAGFKAAGNSSGKSPMQAFASGAGEGLEGGSKSDDKTTEQQDKYLGRKIAANAQGETALNGAASRELNMARTKLALEQAKMVKEGGGFTGKAGTANSQQQLYLRGNALVNNDPEVKLAKSTYDNLLKQYPPDSPEVKAAADAHKKLVEAKRTEHMTQLGIKPAEIEKMGKMPGMAKDNPVPAEGLTKEKFDALPPGAYFINPKDKQVLVKKGPATAPTGGNQPVAPQQSMTPAVPPVPVTAPAGSRADNPDDYE